MLHKIIYQIGVRLRTPKLIEKYYFLKESEKWSLSQLEEYQAVQLKRIVLIAYQKSNFYREKFEEAGIKPEDIQTLNDIKKIPCISKMDILLNTDKIQNREDYKKLVYSETSGSTGEPLIFYRNSEWDAGHRAAQLRGYSWYNVKPWEQNGYFWGYSFSTKKKIITKIFDFLMNRYRLFSYDHDEIKHFSKKLKGSAYLEGYSSMIYEVAKVVNENSLGPFHLKMVKGTSEKIYDSYQEIAKRAFGQKIVSEYGAAETGIIAYECKKGHMHIVMENVIVEEENGEIIVTNLLSDSFPIIRYRLGDSVIIDKDTICSCGMNHQIIGEVLGRVGKAIYGQNSKYPSLTLYYIFKNMAIKYGITINYQGIQKEKGKLEIYLNRDIDQRTEKQLNQECLSYFGKDIEVKLYPNGLQRNYDKKFRDFISYIED